MRLRVALGLVEFDGIFHQFECVLSKVIRLYL
jgi:hypothetical protein